MADKRAFKKLPEVLQTNTLDKFFKSTIDQWFSDENVLKISGYVGRKDPISYDPKKDFYLPEVDNTRQNYQLEPVLVTKDIDSAVINTSLFYDDTIKTLSLEGSNVDNHNRLFKSKAYSWAPPIDIDKFVNYENYYWYEPAELIRFDVIQGSTTLNITTDIIGKKSFTSHNGVQFTNGLKVRFIGSNIAPTGYLNKDYIVEGVGNSINLLDVTLPVLDNTRAYTTTAITDRLDYITIKRGSVDENPWSRTNGWYHKDVLLRGTGTSTGTTYTDIIDNPFDKTGDDWDAVSWDATVTQKATEFAKKTINSNNNVEAIKALEFIEKSLSDVSALVPQEFSSDMSKADMSTFGEDKAKILISITEDIKNNKEEKLNELITHMVDLNKVGLDSFEIIENLKKIGVDTIQFEVALRTRAVDLEKKLDSIPLQTNQLYNQKSALLDQAEERAKQDWIGYEEEHVQFDNQILDIHKKLADLEKEKKEITQSLTTLNSEITQSAATLNFDRSDIAESTIKDLLTNPEINTQLSELNIEYNTAANVVDIAGDVARTMEGLNVGADVAMTMIELTQQKNLLFDQVEEMAKQDWVGYEEEHAQFDNQILEINKKLADIEKSDQ